MKKEEISNTIFRDYFEFSPIPTGVFDIDGRFLFANHTFFNQLGYEDQEGQDGTLTLSSLFKQDKSAGELIRLVCERQVIRRKEAVLSTKEGYHFAALVSARLLRDLQDTALEISFVDISQQKKHIQRLHIANNRLFSFLDNMTLGLFLVDTAGKLIKTNLALQNMLDLGDQELISCPYQDLFSSILSISLEPDIIQRWLSSAAMRILESPTMEFSLKGDAIRHIDLSLFPIWDSDGQSLGWGGLLQDITDIREQTAWKLELLSVLSHDIRTPLATLKGHATALLANHRFWSDDMVLEFLETIDRGVDDLVHQVDRNLALTRVESGRLGLRPEAVDVQGVVHQALERSAGVLKDMPVELDIAESLPQIHVDPARTEEVLMNLLENAVRFNAKEKSLLIRAREAEPWVLVSVLDYGPGVGHENRKTIFEKYAHANHEGSGTGLGLYICRKIVESQGGKIWVESPPKGYEQGAEFIFSLPVLPKDIQSWSSDQHVAPQPVQETARQEEAGGTILVVEDEPDLQTLFYTILTQAGYQVETASDGPAALDVLQSSSFDLVILDWVLPVMSGLAVCRNIRRWSTVPVIVVTSKTAQEDLVAALDAGADDYVTKPFLGDELLARIRALMRREDLFPEEESRDQYRAGNLLIDFESREVWISSDRLELTPTEFEILAYLIQSRRQVLTYDQLIEHLWGFGVEGTRHSLFVHISRLRAKIEEDPKNPRLIQTRWGIGYIFMSD